MHRTHSQKECSIDIHPYEVEPVVPFHNSAVFISHIRHLNNYICVSFLLWKWLWCLTRDEIQNAIRSWGCEHTKCARHIRSIFFSRLAIPPCSAPSSHPLLLMKCFILRTFFSRSWVHQLWWEESKRSLFPRVLSGGDTGELVTRSYLGVINLSLCIRLPYLLPLTALL